MPKDCQMPPLGQNPWLRFTNLGDVDQLAIKPRNTPSHHITKNPDSNFHKGLYRGSSSNNANGCHLVTSLLPQEWPFPKAQSPVLSESISLQNLFQIMGKELSRFQDPMAVMLFIQTLEFLKQLLKVTIRTQ